MWAKSHWYGESDAWTEHLLRLLGGNGISVWLACFQGVVFFCGLFRGVGACFRVGVGGDGGVGGVRAVICWSFTLLANLAYVDMVVHVVVVSGGT